MKTLLSRFVAAFLIAAFLPLSARAADSPSILLQKAIYAEETEGNVDAAIKLYEQIAAEAATSHVIVAQAQYRLAVCYQKKGNKEQAINLLNELVQQFPSDAEMTKKTRQMLSELGAASSDNVSIRKLPLSINSDWLLALSPDGSHLAFEPHGTDDVAICEMATGKSWTIAHGQKDKGPWSYAAFSPDSRWIAYDMGGAAVYVSKLDGTNKRTLRESDPKKAEIYPKWWSPDGTHVIIESDDHVAEMEPRVFSLVDIQTGEKKEITRIAGENRDFWTFSKDGKYVARRKGNYPRKITLLDLKSGRDETIVDHDAGDVFGWFSDDSKLLYTKNRAAGRDLWMVTIKDGRPSGEPELLFSNLGEVWPLNVTTDGRIFYHTRGDYVWLMEGFLTKSASVGIVEPEIPLEEIVASNNSISDRKFGVSLTYPTEWTIMAAVQRTGGARVISFTGLNASRVNPPRITYISTELTKNLPPPFSVFLASNPKPTSPPEIDTWLSKAAQMFVDAKVKSPSFGNGGNYHVRASSFVHRNLNGRPALSWSADFTKKDDSKWVDFVTIVCSDAVIAVVDFNAIETSVETVRPGFEKMVETVKLP